VVYKVLKLPVAPTRAATLYWSNRSMPKSVQSVCWPCVVIIRSVEAELVQHRYNIPGATRALGVPASDLRRLVAWGPPAAGSKQVEPAIDNAEAVLRDGLKSPDLTARLKAAKALLTLGPAGLSTE
jgi:hypothetical protein